MIFFNPKPFDELRDYFMQFASEQEKIVYRELFKHNMIKEVKDYMIKVLKTKI